MSWGLRIHGAAGMLTYSFFYITVRRGKRKRKDMVVHEHLNESGFYSLLLDRGSNR